MSDTSGLQNADDQGVPDEDKPERFEKAPEGQGRPEGQGQQDGQGDQAGERDAQAAEPSEQEPGQGGADDGPSAAHETGVAPEGAEDVTTAATTGEDAAEKPPADFDPAQQPSNPDLVANTEPPD